MANARLVQLVVVNTVKQTMTVHLSTGAIHHRPYSEAALRTHEHNGDPIGFIPPYEGFIRPDYASQPLVPSAVAEYALTRHAKPEPKPINTCGCGAQIDARSTRCGSCAQAGIRKPSRKRAPVIAEVEGN